jgi:RNA polymerase sigma factor (sigma-70 family)
MDNPRFSSRPAPDADEVHLQAFRSGNRDALGPLLAGHQPWIYNLALRMLGRQAEAEDATQDILIRAIQGVGAFRGDSRFSTWLYRIAVNHLLNARRGQWNVAEAICSFEDASRLLQSAPDLDLPDPRTVPVPVEILVEETKTGCMIATLTCLDGRQRLVFILGEIFGASDEVGAEIVGVTPANFRQLLSRARRDLYEYLRGNCSLVNPEASCKCVRKTRAYMDAGFVDAKERRFTTAYQRRVRDVADERAGELMEAYERVGAAVYRNHPFYEPARQAEMLRKALQSVTLGPPA